MEEKDKDQTPSQTNFNNSINNYGTVHGNMGHSTHISSAKPQDANRPIETAESGIWKSNVIKLVSEGRTEEALAEILKIRPPEDIRNQVALLGGRFSQLKIERIAGILEKEMELKELSSIREAIIMVISRC